MPTTQYSLAALADDLPATVASFKYIEDSPVFQSETPYFYQGPLEPDQERFRTNIVFETHDVLVKDLRSSVASLSFRRHGLQICPRPSQFTGHLDTQEGLTNYLNETNDMLRKELGADVVICYDAKFRQSRNGPAEVVYYDKSFMGSQKAPDEPAWQAHLDSTLEGGQRRVRRHLTDAEAEEYFNGTWRVQIVNVWRPRHHPVRQAPLAFCDRQSIEASDLIAVERPSTNRIGYVSFLKYQPRQQWFWVSEQKPDEVSIFLSWDSNAKDTSEFVVHASFQVANDSFECTTRESIETRAIVITKK